MKKLLLSLVAFATMGLAAMAQSYTVEPAAETVLPKAYGNYATMSFTFTFDQAVTVGDVTGVKLMKEDAVDGSEITPDDDWRATMSNGGKTVTIWGADYDGFTCYFSCEDVPYYLVIPAGVLTDEEIVIEYYGLNAPAPAALQLENVVPEPNAVLPKMYSTMVSMSFELTFDQAVTVSNVSDVKLMEGSEDGTEIEPMDVWDYSQSNGNKTVTLFGADYDGYTDYFFAKDMNYYLCIPKGVFTAANGATNEPITLMYYGIDEPTGVNDINAAGATEVARYNIAGQRVDASHSGVVIVKMSDGSSVKMIVH